MVFPAISGAALGKGLLGAGASFGASKLLGGLFGGGSTDTLNPAQQAQAQLSFMRNLIPGQLDIIRDNAPGFLQTDLDLSREFSPQFSELQKNVLRQANPESALALERLGSLLQSRGPLGSLDVSPEILRAVQQDTRASQADRGVLRSPISALTEGQATLGARIAERDKFISLAQALASGIPTITPQTIVGSNAIPGLSQIQSQANDLVFNQFQQAINERNFQRNLLGTALQTFGGGDVFSNLFPSRGTVNTSPQSLLFASQGLNF